MKKQLLATSMAVALTVGAASAASASSYEPAALDTTITFEQSDGFWQTTGHPVTATASDDEQLATSLDNRWYTTAISTVVDNFRLIAGLLFFLK